MDDRSYYEMDSSGDVVLILRNPGMLRIWPGDQSFDISRPSDGLDYSDDTSRQASAVNGPKLNSRAKRKKRREEKKKNRGEGKEVTVEPAEPDFSDAKQEAAALQRPMFSKANHMPSRPCMPSRASKSTWNLKIPKIVLSRLYSMKRKYDFVSPQGT